MSTHIQRHSETLFNHCFILRRQSTVLSWADCAVSIFPSALMISLSFSLRSSSPDWLFSLTLFCSSSHHQFLSTHQQRLSLSLFHFRSAGAPLICSEVGPQLSVFFVSDGQLPPWSYFHPAASVTSPGFPLIQGHNLCRLYLPHSVLQLPVTPLWKII